MADRRRTPDLEVALGSLRDLAWFPSTPRLTPVVISRLEADRQMRARPLLPGLALWSARRRAVVAAVALVTLLAAAAAGRQVVGAIQIRHVQAPPSVSAAPEVDLGPPLTLPRAKALAGFPLRVPRRLGSPRAAYVLRTEYDQRVVVLAWEPTPAVPRLEGTPWGAILMEFGGNDEVAFKDLYATPGYRRVRVGAATGVWIDSPHTLVLLTPDGHQRTFDVRGNVLAWATRETTYRLETSLGEGAALALARSVG